MYFLQLSPSPSSTVTTWWGGLTFVGQYKGSKINLSFFWQCSCLVMSPASPTYHNDGLWVYTFVNTKYLHTASSPLSSNLCRSCCSSFPWSRLNWCSQNPQEESNATNCNKHRTCKCFFLCPFLLPLSHTLSNSFSFTSLWEQGCSMARERANAPFALGQAHAADGTTSPRGHVCTCA